MRTGKSVELPADLRRLQRRLESWRGRRKVGQRIPEALWKTAVLAAQRHGIGRTASVLKLDYYSLKKRVDESDGNESSPVPTAFVKLPSPSRETLGNSSMGECLIELEDGAGAFLRIRLSGCTTPDILALSRGLRGVD